MELLHKKKRELCGKSRPTDIKLDTEDLAIAFKLAIQKRPNDSQSILIEKMKLTLEDMPRGPYKPFCEAILDMYKQLCKSNKPQK